MRLLSVVWLVFTLFSVSYGAPREDKNFTQHLEDFIGVIIAESGLQIEQLLRRYGENKDFGIAVTYFRTTNFKELVWQLESLPEFKDVVDYLEDSHIDVTQILERVNDLVDHNEKSRHKPSKVKVGEMASSSFIRESIALFPKDKLAALYEQKQKDSPTFREAVTRLQTKEWKRLYSALWNSQDLQKAIGTLTENGLDVRVFIEQIKATFGQN